MPTHPVSGVEYRRVDIRNSAAVFEEMERNPVDMVFHLAAMANMAACEQDPTGAKNTNEQGTINVFSAMPRSARGVLSSTCHVYGSPTSLPITEHDNVTPVGTYATSKRAAEIAALSLDRDIVIVRAFHHTGPGQSTEYALADWAAQIRNGSAQILVGDLSIRRDYSDVRDVVEGYVVAGRYGGRKEIYNLCSGTSYSLENLIEILTCQQHVTITPQASRFRSIDVPDMYGDASKLRSLGWMPRYSIRETLEAMLTC